MCFLINDHEKKPTNSCFSYRHFFTNLKELQVQFFSLQDFRSANRYKHVRYIYLDRGIILILSVTKDGRKVNDYGSVFLFAMKKECHLIIQHLSMIRSSGGNSIGFLFMNLLEHSHIVFMSLFIDMIYLFSIRIETKQEYSCLVLI